MEPRNRDPHLEAILLSAIAVRTHYFLHWNDMMLGQLTFLQTKKWHSLLILTGFSFLTVLTIPQLSAQNRFLDSDSRNRESLTQQSSGHWQGSDWLEGAAQQMPEWKLGVRTENLSTGVRVTSVDRGSAAERVRIQVGDLIVSVGGYQVGMVNGRFYSLAEEINRRADTNGNVTLLLQDHFSRGLASVNVRLERSTQSLSGNLVYRDRDPLPSDAIVTVQIENVTRPHYEVHHGQTSFRPSTRIDSRGNIPFEIAFDPNYVFADDVYEVRATITSRGRTIYNTPNPQRVLTGGNANAVNLALASVYDRSVPAMTAGYPRYDDLNSRLIKLYQRYLDRSPKPLELAALMSTPGIEDRLDELPLEIMAAQEYYDSVGNRNDLWLRKVFQEIVGVAPSQLEFDRWMQRFQSLRYSRTELLRQLAIQAKR